MLSFLFQCCRQPTLNHENEVNVINIDNDSFVPTTSFSFHDMNTPTDYLSDNTSHDSESITSSISEEHKQNHYIYNLLYIEHPMRRNRDVQRLPGPTITTINMAVEQVLIEPHWEQVEHFEIQYNDSILHPRFINIKQAKATDFFSNQQNIIYKSRPTIHFYQPDDDDRLSNISEMHGSDSETIDISGSLFQKENDYKLSTHVDNIQAIVNDFLLLPSNSLQQSTRDKILRESKNVKFSILSSPLNNQIHY